MLKPVAITAAAALTISACSPLNSSGNYCYTNPATCVLLGTIVIAGVALSRSSGGNQYPYPTAVSDSRLKTDTRSVGFTDTGVPLHAFRYLGSDDLFVGPLAEELQADPRFAHVVEAGTDGYLRVDLAALGVEVINPAAMQAAGARALRFAMR